MKNNKVLAFILLSLFITGLFPSLSAIADEKSVLLSTASQLALPDADKEFEQIIVEKRTSIAPLTNNIVYYQDFLFNVSSGYIQGYTGNSANLIIPNKINNIEVKGISHRVFANNNTINSITIPDTLESILF